MIRQDLARMAVELAVKGGLEDIKTDPKRSIRRLVDLGDHFANGRFHKYFFQMLQTMLEDENSAYYSLISRIVDRVDARSISALGINVGYSSWTLGAKIIRANEAKLGFNIPWAVSFFIDENFDPLLLLSIVEQGKQLGIYTYFIHAERANTELSPLLDLFEAQQDCAFVLFHKGDQGPRLHREPGHNVLQFFQWGEHFAACAEERAQTKAPYGCYLEYDDESAQSILSGEWVRRLEQAQCLFAAAVCAPGCTEDTQNKVLEVVNTVRANQRHALFITDLYADLLFVDRVISQEHCFFAVAANERALLSHRDRTPSRYDTRQHKLAEILSQTMPRVTYQTDPQD